MHHYTFVVSPGGHTIGNLLLDYLHMDNTRFSAYKVPHPLSKNVEVTLGARTQTEAVVSLRAACRKAFDDMGRLELELDAHTKRASMPIDYEPPSVVIAVRKDCNVSDDSMA